MIGCGRITLRSARGVHPLHWQHLPLESLNSDLFSVDLESTFTASSVECNNRAVFQALRGGYILRCPQHLCSAPAVYYINLLLSLQSARIGHSESNGSFDLCSDVFTTALDLLLRELHIL